MQIFSLMCAFILILVLQISINQVKSTIPSTKIRRAQTMRAQRTRPSSTSSSSSTASHIVESESKPLASTSAFSEIVIKPIVEEEPRHVRFGSSSSYIDPMAVTQGEHLDPARDGAFARIRNAVVRYGSAVGIGAAVSAGGFAVKQILFQNNNSTQTNFMNMSQNLSEQTDNDVVINSIS